MSQTLASIDINLFKRGDVTRAIREVGAVEEKLRNGLDNLCRKLLDEGVNVAKAQLMAFPAVDTGALMASIGHGAYDPQSKTGIIYAGAYYAFYVEYGTGPIGAANPHPNVTNGTGSSFAVMSRDGRRTYEGYNAAKPGWYYYGDDGQWHYTEGMPSRPFMYNTMMTLKDKAEQEGAKVIGTYTPGGG